MRCFGQSEGRMMMVLVCGIALVWMMTALTSCHWGQKISPPENAIEEPATLIAAISARIEQVNSARFKDVTLEYFDAENRIKLRLLLVVQRPEIPDMGGKLRVQSYLPGTRDIVSLLVSNGQTFSLHRRDTNDYYTGPPTAQNINLLIPLNLSAADVVRVMFGGAPWDRFALEGEPLQLEWNGHTGRYRMFVSTAQGGQLWMEVRPQDFAVVTFVEEGPDGEVKYRYETDDWRRHGDIALPDYRRFIWPSKELDFSVEVGETQLNIEASNALFEFPPPPGSHVNRLGSSGATP